MRAPIVASSGQDKPTRDSRDPRVRLERLVDPGSLRPLPAPDDVAELTARGRVRGSEVIAFCTDARVKGGSLGAAECRHITEAIDLAAREDCPVIGLWHSGGARLEDGVRSMEGIGSIFAAMVRASGKVLQISVILGPAAGGAAYGAALTDLVIIAPEGRLFITGPDIVRSVTGEQTDMEGLGGPGIHARESGLAHVIAESEADAYHQARRLTELLSRPGHFDVDAVAEPKDLRALLPGSPRRAYDVRPLVREILDEDTGFQELQDKWAPNMVIGLGRLAGGTVGVVASNPIRKGGCLDSRSAEKAARFVRMCDAIGIPLLVIVDVPGYLPGLKEEWGGIVRRGAKLLYAFAEVVVPSVTLVTRKSFGGAYIAMNSRSLGATAVFAWPDAEVAVMGAESAVEITHRKVLACVPEAERAATKARLAHEHKRAAGGLETGLSVGAIDEVIAPETTRRVLAASFAAAPCRRGRHGNIGL
jgi:acetyl-CoA/propionyl-CoA carboxylase carboxyl transferase subunit